ncbi:MULTISPECIES: gamma subclass chorismate mutase AroQ [Catenuloplanes]|uniref:chorismate mutase n=1 Tax=Catenuloplanes niger TaxID=587534 RepID=A0AAE3ZU01_9ACTN|nr:gamma subclass chorismate mutase AroQ [Catenuloplanes niger]MDR7325837.1 chorismate mutase [Catenuloplanes niger]
MSATTAWSWRLASVCTVAVAGLVTSALPAQAASVPAGGLTALVGLSAERILLADKVAAAKFGTTAPIEDPVREQQVLDQAAALAVQAGIDPVDTVEFFRAQIESSKVVQRGLFDLWTRRPELAPTERPDLATEVRPELDRITVQFIGELAASESLRGPTPRCVVSLVVAGTKAERQYRLDRLHERALRGAVTPVCAR